MAKGEFEAIAKDIKQRAFAPVYFFCGEEPYFIDALCELIETHCLTEMEKAFNQTIVYGKDVSAQQIIEAARRLPMMAERQLVMVKEAQALSLKEDEEKQYLAYLKNPVKSTVLVFAYKHGKPDGRKSFGKEAQKSAVYMETKPLYENQVAAWAKGYLQQHKYKIEEQAAELLAEFCGTELSKIANELNKLMLGKPQGATFTADDIEREVGVSKDYNVFELSNALGYRDRTKSFRIANYFVANPKSGPLVFAIGTLQNFFSKVYIAQQSRGMQDKDLAVQLKVNPYFLKDYKAAAQQYSSQKLEQVFLILEEYDLRGKGLKGSGTEDGELMREMVFRILA